MIEHHLNTTSSDLVRHLSVFRQPWLKVDEQHLLFLSFPFAVENLPVDKFIGVEVTELGEGQRPGPGSRPMDFKALAFDNGEWRRAVNVAVLVVAAFDSVVEDLSFQDTLASPCDVMVSLLSGSFLIEVVSLYSTSFDEAHAEAGREHIRRRCDVHF